MNIRKRTSLGWFAAGVAVVMSATCACADPSITVTKVEQRYPWNGLVSIDYTIAGVPDGADPNDYLVTFAISSRLGETVRVHGVTNFIEGANGDLPAANGAHRVAWDANADGVAERVDGLTATATLTYAPVAAGEATYLVIDVSGGPDAASFPIRYLRGDLPPSAFNSVAYKTAKIVLKRVSAGAFWMGSKIDNNRTYAKLTKDYFFSLLPITVRQTKLISGIWCFDWHALNDPQPTVEERSWLSCWALSHDVLVDTILPALNARTICRSQRVTGFTLPTEAQWEYVCRAGTTNEYYWGATADDIDRYAWYGGNATRPQVVGRLLPNDWGFYDMAGNNYEWCSDRNGAYATGTEEDPWVDPAITEGNNYAARGGGWYYSNATYCRSASRNSFGGQDYYFGAYRLVLTLDKAYDQKAEEK